MSPETAPYVIVFTFVGLFLIGAIIATRLRRAREAGAAPTAAPADGSASQNPPALALPPATTPREIMRNEVLALAHPVTKTIEDAPTPTDLSRAPGFAALVARMQSSDVSLDDLFEWFYGDAKSLCIGAAAALAQRQDLAGDEGRLLATIDSTSAFSRHYLLAAIARSPDPKSPLAVLMRSKSHWSNSQMSMDVLRRYLAHNLRVEAVEAHAAAMFGKCSAEQRVWMASVLATVDTDAARKAAAALANPASPASPVGSDDAADLDGIREFTQRRKARPPADAPRLSPTQAKALADLTAAIQRKPARSLLLVGEAGVGKTTVGDALVDQLIADGWTVFSARASQMIAGQSFVGQIEERVESLVAAIAERPKTLWLAEDLLDFLTAGRHAQSRTSIFDMLLPRIESGAIRILAPMSATACEALLLQAPSLRTAATVVRLVESPDDETLALARDAVARRADAGPPLCDDGLLAELFLRAEQHMSAAARPGNLLRLLRLLDEHVAAGGAPRAATLDDAITVLSRLTGLPPAVLDERDSLDLDQLRRVFAARVMGQPEAVDCLVERIAMLKAGLCDARRPIGVFLFTGPTGTGKTEICRALAEYLFGGADRMLRLDMSEFQHPESVGRLTGDARGSNALVHRIREQPFQVVLLDEIEKAHPMVFDLFLQVFDEGRLTDVNGQPADFRHAIFIATSNVGVRNLEGSGLGFSGGEPDLMGALEKVFRREFLNRIDRIVVFRALSEATLRDVLRKELDLVVQRRGLRKRPWAVDWDDSAVRFLLQQGWSPTLGARPLRRAIERHVLAPLAAAMVRDDAPEGDQFLFVRSDGRSIQVTFVDPDEPNDAPRPATTGLAAAPKHGHVVDLRTLAREAAGTPDEWRLFADFVAALRTQTASGTWRDRKAAAYAAMAAPDFWNSPDKHRTLGLIELMDRIEGAVARVGERSQPTATGDRTTTSERLRELAARALLLDRAMDALQRGLPQDAYLQIQTLAAPHGNGAAAAAFADELLAMYRQWAERRGMHWSELQRSPGAAIVAVTGFAAHATLVDEHGLHVLEPDDDRGPLERVRVTIAGQPPHPAGSDGELAMAKAALAARAGEAPSVVRRYCRGPSPEIRDRVRGWRTGRWDKVLGGDFDLME